MELSAEQIKLNWDLFIKNIDTYISDPRRQSLIKFYNKIQDQIILLPASIHPKYHNAFPGGYIDHVNRVVECTLEVYEVWKKMGADVSTFTIEELIFSAINHDLGKIGDMNNVAYIPQTDNWRKEKLGEKYQFNTSLEFASVPDRGLFLLQENDIKYTFNEMLAIQTHDGLYDKANEKYLMGFMPEQQFRTCLPYILHQGDLMAAKIEWSREWLADFKKAQTTPNILKTKPKTSYPKKTLDSVKGVKLEGFLDKI